MREESPQYIFDLAQDFRKKPTLAESILWNCLRNNKLQGYKFRRQYIIGRYIVDFYCAQERLAIEIDGEIHNQVDVREYDLIREAKLKSRSIRVIRFSNEDVIRNTDQTLSQITKHLIPLPISGEGRGEGDYHRQNV